MVEMGADVLEGVAPDAMDEVVVAHPQFGRVRAEMRDVGAAAAMEDGQPHLEVGRAGAFPRFAEEPRLFVAGDRRRLADVDVGCLQADHGRHDRVEHVARGDDHEPHVARVALGQRDHAGEQQTLGLGGLRALRLFDRVSADRRTVITTTSCSGGVRSAAERCASRCGLRTGTRMLPGLGVRSAPCTWLDASSSDASDPAGVSSAGRARSARSAAADRIVAVAPTAPASACTSMARVAAASRPMMTRIAEAALSLRQSRQHRRLERRGSTGRSWHRRTRAMSRSPR